MSSFTTTETCKSTTTTTSTTTTLLPDDKRCAYPSKICPNPRAEKLDHKLHKLCELHRRKANLNQQRLQQRRRMGRERGAVVSSPSAPHHFDDFGTPLEFPNCEFSPEELKVLELMLFDNDEGLQLALGDFDQAYE